MSAHSQEDRRVVSVPSTGTRVSLVLAVLLLIAAVYFLVSPVQVMSSGGRVFDCGTALSGPATNFGKGVCSTSNKVAVVRASFLGVSALIVAVGGLLAFGMNRREDHASAGAPRPTTRSARRTSAE